MNGSSKVPSHKDLADFFRSDLQLDTVRTIDTLRPTDVTGRRARFHDARLEPMAEEVATLLWDGTCLRWDFGREIAPATSFSTSARRAWWWNKRAPIAPPRGEVVQQLVFEQLEKAQIGSVLTDLDRRLTPEAFKGAIGARGVRRWENGGFKNFDPNSVVHSKKILLFIHGTFSDSESLLTNGLMRTKDGPTLLGQAEACYDLILSFDHPTLSVSPALNAIDLAHVLRPLAPTRLDIVCHSRGGLVARWFCEMLCPDHVERHVILVASPIAGTSLAAAPRVRDFFDFLTNAANTLRKAADLASLAAPWLTAVAGLMRLGTALTGGLARLPIADGLIALVPGLQGQARVGNNEEISRLQRGVARWHSPEGKLRYFAVTSDFEPAALDGDWSFLAYFRKTAAHVVNAAADRLFPYANDLVVDTDAMTDLNGKVAAEAVQVTERHQFPRSSGVHHCNYFRQPETVARIGGWLKIPRGG